MIPNSFDIIWKLAYGWFIWDHLVVWIWIRVSKVVADHDSLLILIWIPHSSSFIVSSGSCSMRGKPSATNEEDLFGGSSSSQIHLVLHLGLRSWVVFSTAQSFGPVLPVFSLVKGKPWFLQKTTLGQTLLWKGFQNHSRLSLRRRTWLPLAAKFLIICEIRKCITVQKQSSCFFSI